MAFTEDRLYLLKEITGGDHKMLLQVTDGYARHLLHADGSLLSRYFAHFRHPDGRDVVAMAYAYDLKGCDDDKTLTWDGSKVGAVHKRCWSVGMWCQSNWSEARRVYHAGKAAAQRRKFAV